MSITSPSTLGVMGMGAIVVPCSTLLREHAAKNLPPFKRPQRIHFMDQLPRTATGKVQRFKLRRTSAGHG